MTDDTKQDGAPEGQSASKAMLGTCGHFCEACARRDDEIARLKDLVHAFCNAVDEIAFSMKAPNSYTPKFIQLTLTARINVVPNGPLKLRERSERQT